MTVIMLTVTNISGGLVPTQCSQTGNMWPGQTVCHGLNVVCLGSVKHLAGIAGQVGAVGKEGRVPILPHPALPGRLANAKTTPSGTALCTENKFFWYQLKFGRKWLLGGRKLDSAHISTN